MRNIDTCVRCGLYDAVWWHPATNATLCDACARSEWIEAGVVCQPRISEEGRELLVECPAGRLAVAAREARGARLTAREIQHLRFFGYPCLCHANLACDCGNEACDECRGVPVVLLYDEWERVSGSRS